MIFPGKKRGGMKALWPLKDTHTHSLSKRYFSKNDQNAQNVLKYMQHQTDYLFEFYFFIIVKNFLENYLFFFYENYFFLGLSETYLNIFCVIFFNENLITIC